MKEVFRKIASFSMALVVLFSTLSFTVDMHYCGDTLVNTAILHKAESCGMEMDKPSTSSDCEMKKKNCCSNKQLVVEGQDELKTSSETLSFEQQIFVATFVFSYVNLFEELEEGEEAAEKGDAEEAQESSGSDNE